MKEERIDLALLFAAENDPVKTWQMFTTPQEELAVMMAGIIEVEIGWNMLLFTSYPFEPSVAFRERSVMAREISEANIAASMLWVKRGEELLFIPIEKKDELLNFATRNSIPVVDRPDVWSWILEPFLDTELTTEDNEQLDKLLSGQSLSVNEVLLLRREVEVQMLKYNFDTTLWEWVCLGLYDVLKAMRGKYRGAQYEDFYWRAMRVALGV